MKNYQKHSDDNNSDELKEDSWDAIQEQIQYFTTGILISTEMIQLLREFPESVKEEIEKITYATLEIERLSKKLAKFR